MKKIVVNVQDEDVIRALGLIAVEEGHMSLSRAALSVLENALTQKKVSKSIKKSKGGDAAA